VRQAHGKWQIPKGAGGSLDPISGYSHGVAQQSTSPAGPCSTGQRPLDITSTSSQILRRDAQVVGDERRQWPIFSCTSSSRFTSTCALHANIPAPDTPHPATERSGFIATAARNGDPLALARLENLVRISVQCIAWQFRTKLHQLGRHGCHRGRRGWCQVDRPLTKAARHVQRGFSGPVKVLGNTI